METLYNGYTLESCDAAFPLSTDSMLLSGFVKLPKNASVLDLGSGCGTLGLLLCAKDPGCTVTGVELNGQAHAAALKNIQANGLEARLSSICGDFRTFTGDNYRVCVSNPPYFSAGPASKLHPTARREDTASMRELFAAAARSLRYGGDFFLVHRPERLAELCVCASGVGLEPKRLQLVRHKKGGPITLILLSCRKGGKPGLQIEEIYLFEESGEPSQFYRTLYHI